MRTYVGTSGYSYPEWKGTFYPEKMPTTKMLNFYGTRFDTVEINNTFYRTPSASVLQKWANDVPENFSFVLKGSQRITHIRRLNDVADSVVYFFETATALASKLGPVLFQLPPNMKQDLPRLETFLALLPSVRRVAFEFRHASWYDEAVFEALRRYQAALCLADTEDGADAPFVATAPWGYLRLRRGDYTDDELQAWAARIREPGWSDAYVFFKHEDEGKGPKLAERFKALSG